ncbi:DUF4421 family protein [Niabella aquatica]
MNTAIKYGPIIICLFTWLPLAGQDAVDTAYIQQFEKPNTVEIFAGKYTSALSFSSRGKYRQSFNLVANSNFYNGVFLSYNWLSAVYSWALPHTYLDDKTKFKYTSLEFTFRVKTMIVHPYYDSYNGLLIPQQSHRGYQPFQNARFSRLGCDIYWYTNRERFSSRTAFFFSEKQAKNAGAVFYKLNPQWQKINILDHPLPVADTTKAKLLLPDKEWISLTGSLGYNYTFVFRKSWCLSPSLALGGGGVKEVGTGRNKRLRSALNIDARVIGGYNGNNAYAYINSSWEELIAHVDSRNLKQPKSNILLTVGYRFKSLHKKMLHLL